MRPSCEHILKTLANSLVTEYMGEVSKDKAKTDLGLMALLLGVVSEECERNASRRIEENAELREFFSKAWPVVQDDVLRDRLTQASQGEDKDYRISALDKTNCDLIELLIKLHAHVENLGGEDARRTDQEIWQVLGNWTKRREFMTSELFIPVLLMATLQKLGQ
jgi:hypothetical protein